jgi:hypothetical protein
MMSRTPLPKDNRPITADWEKLKALMGDTRPPNWVRRQADREHFENGCSRSEPDLSTSPEQAQQIKS